MLGPAPGCTATCTADLIGHLPRVRHHVESQFHPPLEHLLADRARENLQEKEGISFCVRQERKMPGVGMKPAAIPATESSTCHLGTMPR